MLHAENQLLERVRTSLEKILGGLPDAAKIEWDVIERSDQKELASLVDLTVGVNTNHRRDILAIEFDELGHPSRLRAAVNRLLRFTHRSRCNDYAVVAAPYITAEGAAVCKEEKVGYFDLAGNCRLAFGNYYIERTGNPNPDRKNQVTATPGLYAPKSERVLRVLFEGKDRAWRVVPLSDYARVSLGTVSTVRTVLLEREWAKETAEGIRLTHPEKLLGDWATVWSRRRQRPSTYFTLKPLAEVERQMAGFARQLKRDFALTGAAGAWRHAPMVRYNRAQAYWHGEPGELAEAVGLKPADVGANVQIMAPRDAGVFFDQEEFDGIPVVAPLQIYLDLQNETARGPEAASELWRLKLFPGDVIER